MTEKPESTPIRAETKKKLKIYAALNEMSLVDYLDEILNDFFSKNPKTDPKNKKKAL